ncbi:serine carboxypeptidase-like [Bidens hawaiensis]|uniref:serine carboxypeptidase-like n=1 Tax=Bidens hawaiensis TaxID=980011 RepID=UPI00404B93AA
MAKQTHDPSSTSQHTETEYEFNIKALNLHPKLDANIFKPNASDSVSISNSRFVEKPLRLTVLGEPGATIQNLAHLAGYVKLNKTIGARIFYYFFQSRTKKDDPLVLWLTGGPGCSGAIALFIENGPFHLINNSSLTWNDFGWDKVSNIIFIDQPTGTGFSYSSSDKDLRRDQKGVSDDLYDFMQGFLSAHPDLVKNDFYLAGESYAGHFIPAFATRIIQGNANKNGVHINFKGIAIGNGLTAPGTQYASSPDYALENKLINKQDFDRINKMVPDCEKTANECATNAKSCLDAPTKCHPINTEILTISKKCQYDIRRKDCYDLSKIEQFLNTPSTKQALGVPPNIKYAACSGAVGDAMKEDIFKNLAGGIPDILKNGIKVLIYAGEYDLICSWLGNYRWVKAMNWPGQAGFGAAKDVKFDVDGKEAGLLKIQDLLTFLRVRDAGHMVPLDQPKASLQMLKMWMEGKLH